MTKIMLDDGDFRVVGGKERKFVGIPLSKWNEIVILINDAGLADKLVDLDVICVRIKLED